MAKVDHGTKSNNNNADTNTKRQRRVRQTKK
jgi:hypothetical protein